MRALAAPLASAGFLPAAVPGMEPEYLAEGLEGDRPGAVVAYAGGRPVAYMPFAFRRADFRPALGPARLGRFPYRQLRLFGYAAEGGGRAALVERFLKILLGSDAWHIAQLFDVPAEDPLRERFARAPFDPRRYRVVDRVFDTIQVRLDENFSSYLRNQFTKKSRYNLKREVRLLEEAAPVAMKVYAAPDEAAEFLGLAESIARRTYQWKLGLATVIATPALVEKTSYLARNGRLRSYMLFVGGAPAAYCYATIRRGELSYDNVGYDPRFARMNPGKVLLYKILEELHESRAVPQLEFGRGMAEYKLLFANSRRRVFDVDIYPRRPYPEFLRRLRDAADLGYHTLRPLLRPWVPAIKRRLRDAARLLLPGLLDAPEYISQLSILENLY